MPFNEYDELLLELFPYILKSRTLSLTMFVVVRFVFTQLLPLRYSLVIPEVVIVNLKPVAV